MDTQLRAEVERIVADTLATTGPIRENTMTNISREDRQAIGRTAYFAIKAAMGDDVDELGEIIGTSKYPAALIATELALMGASVIRRSSTRARRLAELRRLVGID